MRESMDRIARFFDIEYEDFEADLPIIEAFAQRTGGPLLELGCGTGRLLTPLARRGYHVTGVDISPAMLRLAGAKADAAAVAERITLVEGDYSAVALAGRFQFAFTVMNTFMYLVEQETQLRALRHWRGHLAPNGMLLIDVFNPDVAQLAGLDGRLEVDTIWSDPQTGATARSRAGNWIAAVPGTDPPVAAIAAGDRRRQSCPRSCPARWRPAVA